MKKKHKLIIIIAAVVSVTVHLLWGVHIFSSTQSWKDTQVHRTEMIIMAEHCIPDYQFNGPHNLELRVIDKDDFGRYMFEVEHPDGGPQAYIIVQKENEKEKKIYYYEDRCTLLIAKEETVSKKELRQFKEENDWDLPLCEDNMSSVPRKRGYGT